VWLVLWLVLKDRRILLVGDVEEKVFFDDDGSWQLLRVASIRRVHFVPLSSRNCTLILSFGFPAHCVSKALSTWPLQLSLPTPLFVSPCTFCPSCSLLCLLISFSCPFPFFSSRGWRPTFVSSSFMRRYIPAYVGFLCLCGSMYFLFRHIFSFLDALLLHC